MDDETGERAQPDAETSKPCWAHVNSVNHPAIRRDPIH